jgi:hypothetical protein
MKICRKDPDNNFEQWRDRHVLTIAKAGGSALDVYAWGVHGVDVETIEKFADQINGKYQVDCLYPKAPVSALPFRYFHFVEENDFVLYHLEDFNRHMQEFIELNRTRVQARKILVDLHRDSDPVWDCYLTAAERAFKNFANENDFDEIVLMK